MKSSSSETLFRTRRCLSIAVAVMAVLPLHAEVKLPAIFGDHMVLQQETKVPVWGTADPGEKVIVLAGNHSGTATADDKGRWRVDLAPFAPGTPPLAVTVVGKNELRFDDVLIGDVWIAAGQSNMAYNLRGVPNIKDIADHLDDQQMRIFLTPQAWAFEPCGDVKGHWAVASRETLWTFSAVAYFFGHDLRQAEHRPIGLVESSVGGTVAQSWTSISGLEKDPPFNGYIEAHKKLVADYPVAGEGYGERLASFQPMLADWNAKYGRDLDRRRNEWRRQVQANRATGLPPPPEPVPGEPRPLEPADPLGGPNAPGNLFNGMIAPLIPFAMKGVIWYQGESNALGGSVEYRTLFPRLIADWREKWGEGDFPFLYVQIAAFADRDVMGGGGWPLLQEAQSMARSMPNTGMTTAIDIGDRNNIHPADKVDVGLRLARMAKHLAYGQSVVDSGPVFDKMTIEGGTARIGFTQVGGGLVIGLAPWTVAGALPIPTTSLVGFVIAGADRKFVIADAKIDGNTVVVSSPQVPHPVAVRYDFANFTMANLYNKDGLPAFPFRTDQWDAVMSPAVGPQMAPVKSGP